MTEPPVPYAGDVSPEEAWQMLSRDTSTSLVDVRTAAEWSFVGLPDLSSLGRRTLCVEWQKFPSMERNSSFETDVTRSLADPDSSRDAALLFICRSGARSRDAAIAMTRAGFKRAFNVAGGFEGELDGQKHRGQKTGWKAAGLPWRQG